jgi:hypothetical protein
MSSFKTLEGKRRLGRFRRARENSVKINIKEITCEGVDWIHLT